MLISYVKLDHTLYSINYGIYLYLPPPPHPQVWCARISLLMHLGLFQEAERELVAFEELANPDLYYQYHAHSYPNKTGKHGNNYTTIFHKLAKLIKSQFYSDM
jgi:hypothetical protein